MTDHNLFCNLILKGGRVIDPANAINGTMDIGIAGGKIARLERSIPP